MELQVHQILTQIATWQRMQLFSICYQQNLLKVRVLTGIMQVSMEESSRLSIIILLIKVVFSTFKMEHLFQFLIQSLVQIQQSPMEE
jgi:hypothetical protein